jgi:agmatinase
VRRLAYEVGFAGMEVVEVSPPYDHAETTAFLAHRIILEALSGLALRKLGREPKPERSA